MFDDRDRQWLYERMQSAGINTGSYDDFKASLNNKEDRDWYYNKSVELGLDVGSADDFASMMVEEQPAESYNTREANLEAGVDEASNRARKAAQAAETAQATEQKAQAGVYPPTATPRPQPAQTAVPNRFGMPQQGGNGPLADAAPHPLVPGQAVPFQERVQKEVGLAHNAGKAKARLHQNIEAIEQGNTPFSNGKTKQYDPATGEVKDVYMTTTGQAVSTPFERDMANIEASPENRKSKELEEAYAERERLEAELEKRGGEVEGDGVSLPAKVGATATSLSPLGFLSPIIAKRIDKRLDPEWAMLKAAMDANNRHIAILERDRDHDGFFRSVGKTLFDIDTWDFGINDIANASTLMFGGEGKMEGKAGEAQEAMLRNTYQQQVAEQLYSKDDTFFQRAGDITANAIPFVLEFIMTGGGYAAISAATTRMATKAATKIGAKGFAKWALKNTGTLAGNTMSALLMANTTGAAKTASDILGRHQGELTRDENGNYIFQGGKSWGRSVYEGEMAQTIEYFTEMLGNSVFDKALGKWVYPAAGKLITKGLEKLGAGRVSELFSRLSNSQWTALLNKGGIQGYPSEVLEEVSGIIFNSLLVGDNQFSDLWDRKTLEDILGGMALSIGFMQAPGVVHGGYNTAQYYRFKHNTDQADKAAASVLGADWETLKEQIDGTQNADMNGMIESFLDSEAMTDEAKAAAVTYIYNLMKMRGYNLRTAADAKDRMAETDENGDPMPLSEEQQKSVESYLHGYNADEQERRDIAIELSQAVEGTPEHDYATTAWLGVEQSILEEADAQATQEREEAKKKQDKDGNIRPVLLREVDGEGNNIAAYIIDGNVEMVADGSMVDPEASDESIVIFDPATGERRMISPSGNLGVMMLGASQTADMVEQDIEARRQAYIQQATEQAQGKVNIQVGQPFTIPENGVQGTVSAIEGDNAVLTLADGSTTTASISAMQQAEDEKAIADYNERHAQEQAEQEAAAAEQSSALVEGHVEGLPDRFTPGMELTFRDDHGKTFKATVTSRGRMGAQGYTVEDGGPLVEFDINGKTYRMHVNDLVGYTIGYLPTEEQAVAESATTEPATAPTPTEAAATEEEQQATEPEPLTPAQQTYQELVQKFGDKASKKITATVADREAELKKAKTALDKAQDAYDNAPIGKDDKQEAALMKAQAEYEAALAEQTAWDEVRKLRDQALLAKAEEEDAARKAELERRRAEATEAEKAARERYEAEMARRRAEAEAAEKRRQEENARMKAEEEARKANPQPPVQQVEEITEEEEKSVKGSASQLEIAKRDLADDPEALAMLEDIEPTSLEDLAAMILASGKNAIKVQRDSFLAMTGFSNADAKRFPFIFGKKEDGAVTIEHLGEMVYESARNHNIPFDEFDATAGLTAVLNVLGSVNSQADINDYVVNSRIALARDYHNQVLSRIDDIMRDELGVTQAEYEVWVKDLEEKAAAIDEQKYNELIQDNDEQRAETNNGTPSAESAGALQAGTQEGVADATETADAGGAAEDEGGAVTPLQGAIATAEQETDTNPTDGQKEAGNYKKGHVNVEGFDFTIENPKGSQRSGVDLDGRAWSQTMHNTYGYIRGTEGVDGDHIDMFLSDTPEQGDVFVVDQVDPKTGKFDEHKVMYGFADEESAREAYLSNYEDGWKGLGTITHVSKDEFKKWIESSHRKTKPFAEYKSVKASSENATIPMPPVDAERIDGLIEALAAAYESGDVNGIREAAAGIRQYVDEGYNSTTDYDEELEDYEGNDGHKLAQRYLTHVFHDRYLDDDSDQLYIESGMSEQYAKKWNLNRNYVPKSELETLKDEKAQLESNLSRIGQYDPDDPFANSSKEWAEKTKKEINRRLNEINNRIAELEGGKKEVVSKKEKTTPKKKTTKKPTAKVSEVDVMGLFGALKKDGEAKLSDHAKPVEEEAEQPKAEEQPKTEEKPKASSEYGSKNTLFIEEEKEKRVKALRERFRSRLSMNIDPENLADMLYITGYHLEAGVRKFSDFCKKMIEDFGDFIRPYLKQLYSSAKYDADIQKLNIPFDEWTSDREVNDFDVLNFDKQVPADPIETAEHIVKELEVEEQMKATTEVKPTETQSGYTVTPTKYTTKKGRELDLFLVKFDKELEQDEYREASTLAKEDKGWWDREQGGFLMRSQDAAEELGRRFAGSAEKVEAEETTEQAPTAEATPEEEPAFIPQKTEEKAPKTEVKAQKTSPNGKKSVSLQSETEPDLFSGIEDNDDNQPNNSSNETTEIRHGSGEEGSRGHEPQQNGTLGGSPRNATERTDGRGVAGGNSAHPRTDESGSRRVPGRTEGGQRIEQQDGNSPKKNLNNNRAEHGKDYAPKSVDARIDANIAAIELSQQLAESGRQATAKEMAVLRKFSGWGGLGKAFAEDSFTSKRLRELLGDEAYEQANMSRYSAYYTPASVIDALWEIARTLGFKGGNVLEGSAGIGNILGLMPADMSERSDIRAVEIDNTTGTILSQLYPDAKVEVQGFEATKIPNGSVDLAITNVPFVTGLRVNDTTGDKDLSKKFHDIHDFCIAKNIRKLKDGGIGIFITSSGTLDNSRRLREWIDQEGNADVIGAFRLNNETFGGTGATSDIIIVRKRVNGQKSPNAIDVLPTAGERTAEYDTGETKKVKGETIPIIRNLSMDYNKYFIEHPENMAGKMYFGFEKGDTYRPTSKALYPVRGISQDERLSEWAASFEGKEWDNPIAETTETTSVYAELGDDVKEGSIIVRNNRLCVAQMGLAKPLMSSPNDKKGEVVGKTVTEEELIKRFQDKKVKGHTKVQCFESYKAIKDALGAVLQYQSENEDDEGLQPLLAGLNRAYDTFVRTYGHFHKNTSLSFLKNDVDFANVLALEKFSERPSVDGKRIQVFEKTDIFSRRVVDKEKAPEPDNVKDGIIASIYVNGHIDLPWMAEVISRHREQPMSEQEVKEEIINSGLGYENPVSMQIETSYEYLSGNVREKLRQAEANNEDGRYNANIKALQRVIPMDIPAHLIEFSIGSSWVDPELYEAYVKDKTDVSVKFTAAGGTWHMSAGWTREQKNRAMGVVSELLGETIMGTDLIEAAMQNKTITVSKVRKHYDGSTETVTDKEATSACATKIDEIRQDFKDWARARMQSDPELSKRIETVYNDTFNNYVPKSIPDEFVPAHFSGAATIVDGKPFALRPHQAKAAVRATTQPVLLAHEVGTGKTYTMITAAMEMRRLGTANKPMIVVQNATVGQFVESAKKLYPNAKVLTLDDKDHKEEGRKNFYAKIKYNDWDMIVVPQSVFERIPDSEERQMAYVQEKIEEKMMVLEQMKGADPNGNSMIVRSSEKEIKDLQEQLAGLTESVSSKRKEKDAKREAKNRQNAEVKAMEMLDRQTDDVENFDDMGVDAIFIDEAHEYKHLGFATAMQRGVKGIDPSYSKKAQGVFLKTQAVLEKNNGRNVVFATGTPISNTAAEIWTFMRYLMPADTMKDYGIYYFDDFVRNFGNLTQMLEFTTNGRFKENNRFAGYINLPELVRIWSGVADTVLTREAGGVVDKIPPMEGGKAQDIYLPQTTALRSVMKYVKARLAEYEQMTGKQKKENSHIPLTMYGIAKAAAVDARLVVENAADEPQSKTNEAVRQTLRSLKETEEYKGTVALFADNYQNKKSGFNLYEDIRTKLIEAGVPEEQIVIMKSGMKVGKKLEIFDKVNRGEVRVIMGSTFTLGTGVNIQERLHTLIHLDAPNRPMDYTQRNGRILRQGNLHKDMGIPVRVLRFGVEDSLDVTAYQRLKTKGAIADSIMNGKALIENSMENRSMEEDEDVFGDTVAQLSGSEYAMLKNQVEREVRKYENKLSQWKADQAYCHYEIPLLEGVIGRNKERLKGHRENLAKVEAVADKPKTITIEGKTYPNMDAMADFIKEYNKGIKEVENEMRKDSSSPNQTRTLKVNVAGFDFVFKTELFIETEVFFEETSSQVSLFNSVRRKMQYDCPDLGLEEIPVRQSLLREGLEDILTDVIPGVHFRERIESLEHAIEADEKSLAQVKERNGKPFEFTEQLESAREKLEEYSELMRKELEEKEKKYAEMDANVESAENVTLSDEASDEEEEDEDNLRFRTMEEDGSELMFRIREDEAPKKTKIGYKVFYLHNGKLYPPMVANPNGEETPVGPWLDADDAPIVATGKTGRSKVKAGGKGTQGGSSGTLAHRPGWHLGEIPYALQFNRGEKVDNPLGIRNKKGEIIKVGKYFPGNFVWAEVEYADDVNYQEEAMSYGYNEAGNFQHSLAGLPRIPVNGSYKYRTNANPATDPWVITGAMRIRKILTPSEVDELVRAKGREPQEREPGAVTDKEVKELNESLGLTENGNVKSREGAVAMPTMTYEESLASARRAGYTKKQHDAMIVRNERNARQQIADAIAKLGLTDKVEVRDTAEGLKGKRAKAKGWYDVENDKIVIILGNHYSKDDVLVTILHEGVGHYGLRQLFGDAFDTFLDNVYENSTEDIRREIIDMAKKHNWDFRTATEEYLAQMAEDIDYERPERQSWWGMISDLFIYMLHKLGIHFNSPRDVFTTNELRYLLWRSYMNLTEPGHYRDLFDTAEDISMQANLKVGEFAEEKSKPADTNKGNGLNIAADSNNASHPKDFAKLLNDLRTWYPNAVALITMGEGAIVNGEDAKTVAKLLRMELRPDGSLWLPSDKTDEVLSRLVRAGKRVVIAEPKEGVVADSATEDDDFDPDDPNHPGGGVFFREGDMEPTKAIARDEYERMVTEGSHQFKEAWQDSMLSLKKLYKAVLTAEGKKADVKEVAGYENAYLAENRMHSMSQEQVNVWQKDYMEPVLKAVHELTGGSREEYDKLTDYMMAKHGLERNVVFARRDAEQETLRKMPPKPTPPEDQFDNDLMDQYNQDLEQWQEQFDAESEELYQQNRGRDYAGLTALTGTDNVEEAEQMAQSLVDSYEENNDTEHLWDMVNRATRSSLRKIADSGLMTAERYQQVRDMFEYYIPLQGFDETVAEEVYAYMGSDGTLGYGTPIRHAKGRKSKADDPIATISMNGEASIRKGNRNLMKQRFLNFVRSHPSDLVSVSEVWLRKNDVTGEWEQYFDADLQETDSPQEVERKVAEFEEKMKELSAEHPDQYKRSLDLPNVPFRILKASDSAQHQVMVMVEGKPVTMTINGNPRAAQALNGLTNPDVFTETVFGVAMNAGQWLNRQLSQLYTTRNPEFVLSNYLRDAIYSNCMSWVKESPAYALKFHKNFLLYMNPVSMAIRFAEWENGKMRERIVNGTASETDKMFSEFMLNGGETGWTSLRDIEKQKRDIEKALRREGKTSAKVWKALGGCFDLANRSVENCARFAAYVTSRQSGRSIDRSIWDAKEVSVNFNKKGAGDKFIKAKNQKLLGIAGSTASGLGRGLFVFFNASVQGLNNIARAAKNNPWKAAGLATALFALGAFAPLLSYLIGGDDGDDEDKDSYYNLPEYIRRSNLCFRWRNSMPWITIPLPIEFRAIYGLGELSTGVLTGKERYSSDELTKQYISQVSQVLPLDFMEGGGGWHAFVPSGVKPLVEANKNVSWTGLPIYKKDTPWNENDPQWTKAYESANKQIVYATKWLNEATGGDEYTQGWIDWNPAKIEYMMKGYLGGPFTVYDRMQKTAETIMGKREFEWRNILMASRVLKQGDERTEARKLQSEYFDLKDEYEKTKGRLKGYEKKVEKGGEDAVEYAERIAFLNDSEEYARYLVFDSFKPIFDAYYNMEKEAKEAGDQDEVKRVKKATNEMRKRMLHIIHTMEDGEDVDPYAEVEQSLAQIINEKSVDPDVYGKVQEAYGKNQQRRAESEAKQ